jgi:hypothetical protein
MFVPPYKRQTNLELFMKSGMNIMLAETVNIFAHFNFLPKVIMALGSTHPPTEMSTRNISWGVKAAGA